MGSLSPPMHLKGDPNKSLLAALKKHHREDMFDRVSVWLDSEPGSPASFKKAYIQDQTGVDYYVIDLKDPTTWGGDVEDLPPDELFIDLSNAMHADIKRNAKRSSYEF